MSKPKINIVNEFGNVVDTKYRDELDLEKDIYQVSAVWVVNFKSEILLAQRSFSKKDQPGKWGPAAAGTVDEGETFEVNAYKEAEEEIGLRDVKFEIGPKYYMDNSPRKYFTQWYIARVDKDLTEFTLQEEEVANVKWINKNSLIEDLRDNPGNYINSFPRFLDLMIDY